MDEPNKDREHCSGVLRSAIERANETNLKLYFDKIIEVQSASFDHAVKANSVNVTIVYAGAFFLIQNTADIIPRSDWSVIVLLMSVSLLTFTIWTVGSSYRSGRQTIRASKLLSDENKSIERKLAELEVLDRKARADGLRYYARWGIVFLITIISGFLGALYLLMFYLMNLLNIEFSLIGFVRSLL